MKILYVVAIFLLFCVGTALISKREVEKTHTVTPNIASPAIWSKDGKSVYYKVSEKEIARYVIATRKQYTYDIPEDLYNWDASPNNKRLIFESSHYSSSSKTSRLFLYDIQKKKKTIVLSVKDDSLYPVCWLSNDYFLFQSDSDIGNLSSSRSRYVFTMRTDGTGLRKIARNVTAFEFFCASDGSGFVYEDHEEKFHYFSLIKNTDKPLNLHRPPEFEGGIPATIKFVYLSKEKAVYVVLTDPEPQYKVLDLATLKSKPISLPSSANYMSISPDATRLLVNETGYMDHWGTKPSMAHIFQLPPETVRKIKGLD